MNVEIWLHLNCKSKNTNKFLDNRTMILLYSLLTRFKNKIIITLNLWLYSTAQVVVVVLCKMQLYVLLITCTFNHKQTIKNNNFVSKKSFKNKLWLMCFPENKCIRNLRQKKTKNPVDGIGRVTIRTSFWVHELFLGRSEKYTAKCAVVCRVAKFLLKITVEITEIYIFVD